MQIFEILGSLGVFILLFFGIRWKSAEAGVGWTFRPRNHIILVDDKPGHNVGVLGTDPRHDDGILAGIEWMGLPPVHVHEFPLVHRRVNPQITKETPHSEWILRDPEPKTARHLLRTVSHWAYVPGMEFADGRRADILFQFQATVAGKEGARVAVYDREGKFYDDLNAVVESNVISLEALRTMTYDDFMTAEKDSNSPLMMGTPAQTGVPAKAGLMAEINRTAAQRSGYQLDLIFVYRFDASSNKEEEAAREKAIAEIEMEAAKIRAKGEMADITELIAMIKRKLPNASEDLILQEVSRLGIAKRFADSKNLQAVGGAMLGLPANKNSNQKKKGNP